MSAFALALALGAVPVWASAPPKSREPYSCRLLYDERRKCSFNPKCDKRVGERLKRECLRDGGRP